MNLRRLGLLDLFLPWLRIRELYRAIQLLEAKLRLEQQANNRLEATLKKIREEVR